MTKGSPHRLLLLSGMLAATRLHAEAVPFVQEETQAAVPGVTAAHMLDLDKDGDGDILVATRGGEIGWLRNDRTGFAAFHAFHVLDALPPDRAKGNAPQPHAITAMVAADLDVEHQDDIVVGTSAGRVFHLLRNGIAPDGQPVFDPPVEVALGRRISSIASIAAGRSDADLLPDLVIASIKGEPPLLSRNVNPRPLEYAPLQALSQPAELSETQRILLVDLDDDGFLDIVGAGSVEGAGSSSALLGFRLMGTGTGVFSAPFGVFRHDLGVGAVAEAGLLAAVSLGGPDPSLVFAVERNVDGVIARSEVRVQRNPLGAGADASPGDHLDTGPVTHVAAVFEDLDRNGRADILLARADALLRIEDPAAITAVVAQLPASGPASPLLLVFDVDLDGDPDIVRARADGVVQVLRNMRLHGRSFVDDFVPRTGVSASSDGKPFVGTVEIARLPARQRFAPDTMLFTDFTSGRLHRMGGFFRTSPPLEELFIAAAPTPVLDDVGAARRLAIADLDLDGGADFVLGNGESGAAPPAGQNRLFAGRVTRDGVDAIPLGCTEANDLRGVAVGDVTRDGIPEIAYAAEDNDRVALVFRTDCIGETLLSTPGLGIPNRPNAVAIADLDSDLFGDVVVAARGDDEGDTMGDLLGWYRFDPTDGGGFEPLRRIGRVDGARELLVVDLDRDGRLDLVTSAGSTPGDPARGAVLLFRNLGTDTEPDALFDAPQELLDGVVGPGGAAFSDIDHDGDLDLFMPSEALVSGAEQREQCGVSFAEQIGPLQFGAARCLDRGVLEGRYSRVALADLDGDGVDDVGATSFPDGRLGLFAGHRPFQFLLRLRDEPSQRLIGDGTESCPWALDLDHLGRPQDGPLGFASLRLDVQDFFTPALIGALVLRRDDGDGIPEPDDDAELGRDASAALNDFGSGMFWDVQVPADAPDAAVLPGSARHWLCVLGPPRIANTRLRLGFVRMQARLADLDGGVAVEGLQRNAIAPGFELIARRVFSDGLED